MVKKYILFLVVIFTIFFAFPSIAKADFSLVGSTTATGSASVAMPISGLQITGSGTEPIPVKLFVTSGTLAMSTTTDLTFNGASTGSTIYFSGSLSNVNNALATLTYTRGATGTDTLEVSLVSQGEVFFTNNNHLYKFITGSITANNASSAANLQTAYGATGYLATITSQAENDFVAGRLQGDGWIGGSDSAIEGDWKWLTGPEAGVSFWSGVANGSTVNGNYANWASGEPNQSGNEDCAQFYITNTKWNDLPCTGSFLSGYVVEFGRPGNMPTVAAKNISLYTVENPTVSTLTPADNATTVGLNSNLTIVFSKNVVKGTGNILIKKTSDDTTVETIDVTSGLVTGANSSTITINPNTTFSEVIGYYVTVPGTAFKDNSNNFFTGISTSSAWNFTTGDFTGPLITAVSSSSVASTSATISWTTNENSSSRVSYGPSNSYGSQTSQTDTSPRVLSHSVSLSSLLACSTYHYAVISIDGSTNSSTSTDYTFTTTGCTANVTPTTATSSALLATDGGSTSLNENNSEITVSAPINFTDDSSSVVIQIQALVGTSILESLGRPSSVPNEVGTTVFDVKAIINGTTILDSFDAPITINYHYSDEDVQGLDESTFWLYHYHNSSWTPLDSCVIDTTANTISCTTDNFSIFGLFGKPRTVVASQSNVSGSSTFSCGADAPGHAPELFKVDRAGSRATLYISPGGSPYTGYIVWYQSSDSDQHADTFDLSNSSGMIVHTINNLIPSVQYDFKVQAKNECRYSEMSNSVSSKDDSEKKIYSASSSSQASIESVEPTKKSDVESVNKLDSEPALTTTPNMTPVSPQTEAPKKQTLIGWLLGLFN